MKFLVIGQFVPEADHETHMDAERRRVRELKQQGVLEQAFRRADRTGAYLIVDAPSIADVEKAISTLPFVETGIMKADIEEIESLDFIWAS
jgi:muconolactone delta-isomerase